MRPTTIVLVVDDEPMIRNFVRKILERADCQVLDASGTKEALQISREYQGRIDLLITDIYMPHGENGLVLAKEITKSRCDIKILVISGGDLDELSQLSHKLPFLEKPFSPANFLAKVNQILES